MPPKDDPRSEREPAVGMWRIVGEQKWMLRPDGHPIGPGDATLCEMDLWAEIQRLRKELALKGDRNVEQSG